MSQPISYSENEIKADEARFFDHFSVRNAVEAQLGCPTSGCEAYKDIFTFRRWRALGFTVRKGEKGTRLVTWIPVKTKDDEGEVKQIGTKRKSTYVFCRHQVEPIVSKGRKAEPIT